MFSLLMFLTGVLVGWIYAHQVIGQECEKNGSFYLGSKVYTCTEIKNKSQ